MRLILLFIFLSLLFIGNILDSYNLIYSSTMSILVLILTIRNNASQILAFIYLLYFGLSTLNISTYRGTITSETITLYSLLILFSFIPFVIFKQLKNSDNYCSLNITKGFINVTKVHLLIVYFTLIYIISIYGNVLINQAARFHITPSTSYIVKSALIIPLFYPFYQIKNRKTFILYFLLPILPTIFIGGRGNIIVILGAYLMINFWKNINNPQYVNNINDKIKIKKTLINFGISGSILIFGLYFLRRIFNRDLINVEMILKLYKFPSDSWLYILILPLYTAFRETIGISNVIIENNFSNTYSEMPLFFSELFTIMPGNHVAPGQVLGKEVIGSTLDGGLTPGLLGGLYIDFGWYSIFGSFILLFIICIYYVKSRINNYSLMIFALCFVQYIHLFHRGFLKIEYFTYIILLLVYFIFTKKKVLRNA
jgi:hypothetical protein